MRRGGLFYAFVWAGTWMAVCAAPAALCAQTTGWLENFQQAEAEAKRLGRPLLIHFHAEWCGPCRRMERDIFRSPDFLRQLEGKFVAVKIDSDAHPELVERFNVHSLPSDVFVDPSGRILGQSTGYVDRERYLGQMARMEAKFAAANKTQLAKLRETIPTEPSAQQSFKPAEPAPPPQPEQVVVGLGGFSPISLWNWREWRRGTPEFAADYQGVTFYMATADELKQFEENPEQYVPKLLGCDPVVMSETDRAISGTTKFGAYYNGELYLFASADTRQRFKENPQRFTSTRHVLKVDQIEPTQLR